MPLLPSRFCGVHCGRGFGLRPDEIPGRLRERHRDSKAPKLVALSHKLLAKGLAFEYKDRQNNCRVYCVRFLCSMSGGRRGGIHLKEIEVKVFDNDLEKAMRILKKKIQNDGLFKRLKLKKSYEKPSEFKRRKQREALRRQRIAAARLKRYR